MRRISILALVAVAVSLGACEFAQKAVVPSVTGQPAPTLNPAPIVPLDVAKFGNPSASPVGARIGQFRDDLLRLQQAAVEEVERGRKLQADTEANAAGYQITIGTFKGQPSPTEWQRAQGQLRTVSAALDQMSALSNEVAKNVAYTSYLLQSIKSASADTSATPDDRKQLLVLEDSTTQTSTSYDQLLDGLRQEVLRQSHFLGEEGAKLAAIAPPGVSAPATSGTAQPGQPGAGVATGRPFVVIRFDQPDVEYEQQLYQAVSAALARRPNVAFDLVAAAPTNGAPQATTQAALASAEKVRQSLLNMGLPPDRISVSQVTDPAITGNEVRIYVR
ncbi:MAG TPA: hypothetical protein VGF43_04415 [Dongiaceae bacterium]